MRLYKHAILRGGGRRITPLQEGVNYHEYVVQMIGKLTKSDHAMSGYPKGASYVLGLRDPNGVVIHIYDVCDAHNQSDAPTCINARTGAVETLPNVLQHLAYTDNWVEFKDEPQSSYPWHPIDLRVEQTEMG